MKYELLAFIMEKIPAAKCHTLSHWQRPFRFVTLDVDYTTNPHRWAWIYFYAVGVLPYWNRVLEYLYIENFAFLCMLGVIHKPRGQIFWYFWQPLPPSLPPIPTYEQTVSSLCTLPNEAWKEQKAELTRAQKIEQNQALSHFWKKKKIAENTKLSYGKFTQ